MINIKRHPLYTKIQQKPNTETNTIGPMQSFKETTSYKPYAPTAEDDLELASKELQQAMNQLKSSQLVWRGMKPFEEVRYWTDVDNMALKERSRAVHENPSFNNRMSLARCDLRAPPEEEEAPPFRDYRCKTFENYEYGDGIVDEVADQIPLDDITMAAIGTSLLRDNFEDVEKENENAPYQTKRCHIPKNKKIYKRQTSPLAMSIFQNVSETLPEGFSIEYNYLAPESKLQSPDIYLFSLVHRNKSLTDHVSVSKYDMMAMFQSSSFKLPHLADGDFMKSLKYPANAQQEYGMQMVRQLFNYMSVQDIGLGIVANSTHLRFIAKGIDGHSEDDGQSGGIIWVSRCFPRGKTFMSSSSWATSVNGITSSFISMLKRGDDIRTNWPGSYVTVTEDTPCDLFEIEQLKLNNDFLYAMDFFSESMNLAMEEVRHGYKEKKQTVLDEAGNESELITKAVTILGPNDDIINVDMFNQYLTNIQQTGVTYIPWDMSHLQRNNPWPVDPSESALQPTFEENSDSVASLEKDEISDYLKAANEYTDQQSLDDADTCLPQEIVSKRVNVVRMECLEEAYVRKGDDTSKHPDEFFSVLNASCGSDVSLPASTASENTTTSFGGTSLTSGKESFEPDTTSRRSAISGASSTTTLSSDSGETTANDAFVKQFKGAFSYRKMVKNDIRKQRVSLRRVEFPQGRGTFNVRPEVAFHPEIQAFQNENLIFTAMLCRSRKSDWFGVCKNQGYSRNQSYIPGVFNASRSSNEVIKAYDVVFRNMEYNYLVEGNSRDKNPIYREMLLYKHLLNCGASSIIPKLLMFGDMWQTNKLLAMKPWGRKLEPRDILEDHDGSIAHKIKRVVHKLLSCHVALGSFRLENFGIDPTGRIRIVEMHSAFIFDSVFSEPVRERELATLKLVLADVKGHTAISDIVDVMEECSAEISRIKAEMEAAALLAAEAAAAAAAFADEDKPANASLVGGDKIGKRESRLRKTFQRLCHRQKRIA